MYQLVVTLREEQDRYQVHASLYEQLPGGGVGPLADSGKQHVYKSYLSSEDPFVRILQALYEFAASEAQKDVASANSQALF